MEDVCGIEAPEPVRALRRLLYCGEWIESHALHVFFLHGPDFLGYEHAFAMARDHRTIVERALQLKQAGNALMRIVGGREIHPVNVRVGGFYRAPTREELAPVTEQLRIAREFAIEAVGWAAALPMPEHEEEFEFVALTEPDRYAIESGRLASSGGLDLAPSEFSHHFEEHQVPHSTALHSRLRDGRAYLTGPLARYALGGARLAPVAREAASAAGLGPVCQNPYRSIVVRAVEILHAADEALRLIDAYEPPDPPALAVAPQAGIGYGWTEAPRGMLWHRYEIDAEGSIVDARIVPPTSQNQARIEESLAAVAEAHADAADAELQRCCERAVRSFDPCISCATHFLRLEIERC
jgi:coenzyme F420-reducing hydrogenase alpha subunit